MKEKHDEMVAGEGKKANLRQSGGGGRGPGGLSGQVLDTLTQILNTHPTDTEGTDFGQSLFGHPDLTNLGQSNFGSSNMGQNSCFSGFTICAAPEGWGPVCVMVVADTTFGSDHDRPRPLLARIWTPQFFLRERERLDRKSS